MSHSIKNIYCISGLGADEKAFERLNVNGCSWRYLNWIAPLKNEALSSYAGRMLHQVEEEHPIILGLSFGGMIAMEMAKKRPVEKLILISTVKTTRELPRWMRVAGMLNLHKLVPIKTNRFTERADDRRMGIETIEEKSFIDAYRKKLDAKFIDWAVDQILKWKNDWIPSNAYHIHGENDRMFPVKNIQRAHVIKKGSHIMILNKADEISACIRDILPLN